MRSLYYNHILKPAIKAFYFLSIVLSVYLLTTPYYEYAMFPFILVIFLLVLGYNPELAFHLIVFMIPYESLRILSNFYGSLTISKFLGLWVIIIVLFYAIPLKRFSLNLKSKMWLWLLIFFAINFISALFGDFHDESFDNLRKLMVAYIFITLATMFISNQASFKKMTMIIILSISFSAIVSIIGYALDMPTFILSYDVWKRLIGTANNPNHYAFILIFSLPLLVHWILTTNRNVPRISAIVLLCINGIGIFLTYSRGGAIVLSIVLCFIIAQYFIVFDRRYIKYIISFALISALLIFILMPSSYWDRLRSTNTESRSVSGRITYLYAGWEFFRKNPILGSGPGSFDHLYPTSKYSVVRSKLFDPMETSYRDAHNTYIEIFVGTGILGTLVFLIIIFTTLKNLHLAISNFKIRRKNEMVGLIMAYRLSFLSILFYFFMLSRLYHKYFWLSVAISQIALKLSNDEIKEIPNENTAYN